MVSEKQLIANQFNSRKGGVKTHKGKQISKYNATKHNVFTQVLIKDEVITAHEIEDRLSLELKPSNFIEEMLIKNIAISYLRWMRAIKAEKEYLQMVMEPTITETKVHRAIDLSSLEDKVETRVIKEGFKPRFSSNDLEHLTERYSRYIMTCERQFYKALSEYKNTSACKN